MNLCEPGRGMDRQTVGRTVGRVSWPWDGAPGPSEHGKKVARAGLVPAAEQSSRPYYGPFSRPRSSGGTFEQHAVCKTRAVFARAGRPCTRCGTGEPPGLRARYPALGPRCQFARQHVEASDTSVGKSTARKRFGQPRKAGIQIQAPAKLKPRHAICPKLSFTLSKGKRLLLRSGVCNAGWDLRWSSYWW